MSTENDKTVEELLGRRIFGLKSATQRIDRIAYGVGAMGNLFGQINDGDYSEGGGPIRKTHRLMGGLYGCLETMGYYLEMETSELRNLLGMQEDD